MFISINDFTAKTHSAKAGLCKLTATHPALSRTYLMQASCLKMLKMIE
jgi:hypothetical protein